MRRRQCSICLIGPIVERALALVPTIGFYLLAERQIIDGLTAGAVKG